MAVARRQLTIVVDNLTRPALTQFPAAAFDARSRLCTALTL